MKAKLSKGAVEDWLGWKCPACGHLHSVPVTGPRAWDWNGSCEQPTLTPSVRHEGAGRCHYHVTEGRIKYENDCTHSMKGQTVELPELQQETKEAEHGGA